MSEKSTINYTTTSFVTEVLASAGQLEKDDLNAKLGKLSNRIQQVKVEVFEDLRQKYEEFSPDPSLMAAQGLSARVTDLQHSMEDMAHKIEKEIKSQLNVSTAEFQSLSSQVEESNQVQNVLGKLVKINALFDSIDKDLENSNYVEASNSLKEIGALLDQPVMPIEGSIHILTALKKKYALQEQDIKNLVSESWSKVIKWTIPTTSAPSKNSKAAKKTVELSIDTKKKAVLTSAAQTLYLLDLLDGKLDIFAERFLQHVVKPLASNSKTKVVVSEDPFKVTVTYSSSNDKNSQVKPLDVFTNLCNVLTPLQQHFLDISVGSPDQGVTLMQKLGKQISADFIDIITKECLAPAIPSSQKDLQAFEEVVGFTKIFQKTLISLRFLGENDTRLTEFFGNVGSLFANKRCQEILEKARELMCSEIHNMVQVDADHPYSKDVLPPLSVGGAKKAKMAENAALAKEPKLSGDSFRLPKCYVSTSVVSLLELAYSTMEEACDSEPACAVQLFYCVRNVFELFCTAVPMYHKESLASLPQLAALHHNNCQYLAHFLLTLGHQYSSRLQEALGSPGACTFVDLVPRLRRQATDCFLDMMRTQRDTIMNTLQQANGFGGLSEPNNLSSAERAVKQMLYQLQRLASVWGQVLPVNIYCKSMGTLLNAVMENLLSHVLSLEDISADDASHLHTLMQQIKERGSRLLQPTDSDDDPVIPHKHVPKWNKFSELMVVLNAGLHDIGERWAEGKGPSAAEFSANEMKHLIRALFQNTTRRDTVLAKIK